MLASLVPPLTLPRARVEPIRTAPEALSVVSLAMSRPLREEVVVVTCDRSRTGQSIAVFDLRPNLDSMVHDVVGFVSSSPRAAGVIAAHVRPHDMPFAHDGLKGSFQACLDRAGLVLLHFFTVQHGEVRLVRQ